MEQIGYHKLIFLAKFFIVGTDSDYELFGYPSQTDTVMLNRLHTDDQVASRKSDVWYGVPIGKEESVAATISLQLAPIFDIIM